MPSSPPTLPPVADGSLPARRTRRVRARRETEGRRLGSAGSAVVVCALALVIAAVLNAPGAHKKAYNLDDGWQRDVALAITGPLSTFSHVLLLDRPRVGLQAAAGRSGADDIDTQFGSPTPTKPAPPPKAVVPKRFSPQRPLRLWIAGDSLAIVPGYSILRTAAANRAVEPVSGVDGRVSTGLTRPDVFNWYEHVREQLRTTKARAVVLSFGGNDTNPYLTGVPENRSVGDFGSASWILEYRRRIGLIFDLVARSGGHTVWIGLPQVRDDAMTLKFDVLNAAVSAEAKERPRTVTYIDTYLDFAGADGLYAQYLDRPDGRKLKARADDGVHFEPAGGDIIAAKVLAALSGVYDITSWRKKKAAQVSSAP